MENLLTSWAGRVALALLLAIPFLTSAQGVGIGTSTLNFKAALNVRANVPSLAFISQLRPVTYRFDGARLDACFRTGVLPASFAPDPAARVQSGFLAQQVEQAAQAVGHSVDGPHRPQNARDHYSLSYAQFVVPLVRAVRELSQQAETLRGERAADHAALLQPQAELARLLGQNA